MTSLELWQNIESRLDSSLTGWRRRVDAFGQAGAVKERTAGRAWTDDETFRGLLMAVLSNNTDWSRIEEIQEDLAKPFSQFSLKSYAELPDREIRECILPWFRKRSAGSRTLERDLVNLRRSARRLYKHSCLHGTAESYFTLLVRRLDGDPKKAAFQLGSRGRDKLPAFGVALAAEALKNLGFDVAKPDRHVKRAVASFGLVPFEDWQDRNGRNAPPCYSKRSYMAVMGAVQHIAVSARVPVVTADNAIWLLCAASGLYLTNADLAGMARKGKDPNALAEAVNSLIRSWSDTQDFAEQRVTVDCLVAGLNSERRSARKIFPAESKGRSW